MYLPGTNWGKPIYNDFQKIINNVSIYSWNINGTNATIKKGKLQEFFKDADPDIVCFNEIKTDP